MRIVNLSQGSAEWHTWRSAGIGASESAAIMGVSPYQTRAQLLAQKRGMAPPVQDNPAMARGRTLEPLARHLYEEATGDVIQPVCIEFAADPRFRASLDGMPFTQDRLAEIKCPTMEEHRTAMDGMVPEHYRIQVQHQLMCAELPVADYVSYHPDAARPLVIVEVRADPHLQAQIRQAGEAFLAELASTAAAAPVEVMVCEQTPQRVRLLQTEAGQALELAQSLIVTTEGDFQQAAGWVRTISGRRREVEAERKHLLEPLEEAKRRVNGWLKPVEEALDQSERAFKAGMLRYRSEQQRLRDEEAARLRQIAEDERLQREAEARVRAQKAREEEQARAAAGDIAGVAQAQAAADHAERAVVAAQTTVALIAPQTVVPQAKGVSARTTWSAEITDMAAFLAAVASRVDVLAGLVKVNEAALNAWVRSQPNKDALSLPGVRAVSSQSLAIRGAA